MSESDVAEVDARIEAETPAAALLEGQEPVAAPVWIGVPVPLEATRCVARPSVADAPQITALPAIPPSIASGAPVASRPAAPLPGVSLPVAPRPKRGAVARIAPHALGGLVGGGAGVVVFALLWIANQKHAFGGGDDPLFAVTPAAVAGVAAALTLGFRDRAKKKSALVARAFTALFFGLLTAFGLLLVLALVSAWVSTFDEMPAAIAYLALGVVTTGIGLLRVRRKSRPADAPGPALGDRDWRMKPLLWCGAFVGATSFWVFAVLTVYDEEVSSLRSGKEALLLFTGVLAAIALGATRGYEKSIRAKISFKRRLAGAIGFGVPAALGLAIVLAMVNVVASPKASSMRAFMLVVAVLGAGIGVFGVHLFAPSRRGRLIEPGILLAVLVIGAMVPESAWLRYVLGSSDAARDIAMDHYRLEDYATSLRYFEIACDRGDDLACVLASSHYDAGLGTKVDSKRADRLLRLSCDQPDDCLTLGEEAGNARTKERMLERACALGHGSYCARYRSAVMSDACERRDPFACRDLARSLEGSASAASYYRRACSLGDADSCPRAR